MAFWPARRDNGHRYRADAVTPAAGGRTPHAAASPAITPPAEPPPRPRLTARKLRHAREAQDAVRAAAVLRQPLTHERARELLALLAPYRRRALLPDQGDPLYGLAAVTPARLLELTLRHAAPVLLDVLLPACREHLADRLLGPAPPQEGDPAGDGGLPSTVDLAGALRTVITALRGAGRQHALAIVDAVVEDSHAIVQRVTRLEGPAGHPILLGDLSHTLLRLEGLRLVLEALGAREGPMKAVAYQSRRVARLALRQSAAAINGFLRDRSLLSLRDSLQVIARIDSLIVVALRILDSLQDREEERTPFVKVADEEALDDYVEAIVRLSESLVHVTNQTLAAPEFDELLYVALVRKLKWLYRFCDRLGHDHRPRELDELRDYLALQSAMLGRRCGEALSAAADSPARLASLLPRAEELVLLLGDVGRLKVRDTLAERIAVARGR